ncbi:MAG: DoxX family protein [Planctomycetota bacterium]|nr:DoxX family protein [Planctomycetota bacterium]MDA1162277.1 DoxX family protein [Planctomycetota bacterium]
MKDTYRLALPALILVVVLRMAIGWQLLYEGLWKIDTLSTPKPWSAVGYLKNAQGPLRGLFRNMSGDPDDLGWLDYDATAADWDDWIARFRSHYQLDEKQAASLHRIVEGSYSVVNKRNVYVEALDKLPDGITDLNKSSRVSSRVFWFDAKAKRIYVDAHEHLKPDELEKLQAVVEGRDDPDAKKYLTAVQSVYDRQKKGIGFKEKLLGTLKGNPELVGNDDWQQVGKLQQYKDRLTRYENALVKADQDFEWDHLQHNWDELQTLRAELSGPIKALDAELKDKARSLLTLNQMALGPVPGRWTQLEIADQMTIAGLTIFGAMLLLGLGTRIAAVGAAVMLFNFYMAMPPWPGVPAAPGPEHSYVINKNLIEVIALFGIALMPTGSWFGVDALLARCCSGCCKRRSEAVELTSSVNSAGQQDSTDLAATTGDSA